ncbi:MAG: diguanylate cyclase [Clostridia bacterium]|nr:diguanylate cyclase [Clostridia bacterium]
MDNTPELLFRYLRNILYHPDKAQLDPESLPEEYRKLGMGLVTLGGWMAESSAFFNAMARGELSAEPPSRDNVIAAPMKALQASLRHLTWQTQQVAKGDFSQRVDFMGEFSEAFNDMTAQLKETNERLTEEKRRVDAMNVELNKSLGLMRALTNHTHSLIFVVAGDGKTPVYRNHTAQWFAGMHPEAETALLEKLAKSAADGAGEREFSLSVEGNKAWYSAETYGVLWEGAPAVAHIVNDATRRVNREHRVHDMAYTDVMTGLHNRRRATERMESLIAAGMPFVFSMIDVDYLKYCNDTEGHNAGDAYLKNVASMLQTGLAGEVCRIGGDEFCVLTETDDAEAVDRSLEALRNLLVARGDAAHPRGFSFASTLVKSDPGAAVDRIMAETDRRMYLDKRNHRTDLPEGYVDPRMGKSE